MNNPSHLSIDYLKKYAIGDVFIETGTYRGDTVQLALEYGFKKIHSIEINKELYLKNVERFKNNPEVQLYLGDSVDIIPQIVSNLKEQATFWLDAHASGPLAGGRFGPCPLVLELRSIYGSEIVNFGLNGTQMSSTFKPREINNHTIFVDDRRLLGTAEWGYVTEESVRNMIMQINSDYKIELLDGHIENDVIVASVR
jgi:hypothetical protein